jgi:hypothetical protein
MMLRICAIGTERGRWSMFSVIRSSVGIAAVSLVFLVGGAQPGDAQPLRIESAFPRHLPPGQTTVIHVAVSSRDAIQAAEISPAQGLKVSRIQQRETTQGVLTWSELTIEAAPDAAPGTRTLVLVLPPPTGRTAPLPLTVPTHAPKVADLRVLSAASTPSTLELQLAASDASGDLGDLPYVWFSLGCGSEPLVGVVRGRVTPRGAGNVLVRASLPGPRAPATGKCDLQVRLTDSAGIESNTLNTSVTFTP